MAGGQGKGTWKGQKYLEGLERVRGLVQHCVKVGVQFLTLFAFSSENWRRPESEVTYLLHLFVRAIENEANQLEEKTVCDWLFLLET